MKASLCVSQICILCLLAIGATNAQESADTLRQSSKAFATIAKAVSPSVAFVVVEGTAPVPTAYPSPFDDEFFRRFFGDDFPQLPERPPIDGPEQRRRITGQGSGFVFLVKDGPLYHVSYLLTNNHLVENAESITVRFPDGGEYEAKVTGRDPQSDVAVIEIDVVDIPPLTLAESSIIEVGEWVLAIGNPFGLSHTLTVGVVSAKGRTGIGINDYEDFIQTDAAINPGNSGGPLLNLDGQVVGINTAIFSRSGGYMGVGFAIPSDLAKIIAEQLIEDGQVTRGYLGVVIQPLTTDLAMLFDADPSQGVLIAQVEEGSPADRAGLRVGDIIVSYDGQPVANIGDFRNRISLARPKSRQRLSVVRDGSEMEIVVSIGQLISEPRQTEEKTSTLETIGLSVQEMTPQLAKRFGAKPDEGVVVSQIIPDSIAARAGIQPGVVILEVDRIPIASVSEFEREIELASSDHQLLLLVRIEGVQHYLLLKW